jgi:ABC-2 type transport system permease protein
MSTPSILLPVHETGWRRGFVTLLSKENGAWWGTRRWLIQTIIWVTILNGIVAIQLFATPAAESMGPGIPDRSSAGVMILMTMSLIALTIGAVIIAQEALIDEKQSGTAAWILSKPVSRVAFILSKFIAHGLGLLVTGMLIPGLVAVIMFTAVGGSIAIGSFTTALGLVFLNVLFYLTLTLMLGTLFDGRGAVIAIPIAFMFGAELFRSLTPWLVNITPWGLLYGMDSPVPPVVQVALGQAAPPMTPITATTAWCVLFMVIALWRFTRQEF